MALVLQDLTKRASQDEADRKIRARQRKAGGLRGSVPEARATPQIQRDDDFARPTGNQIFFRLTDADESSRTATFHADESAGLNYTASRGAFRQSFMRAYEHDEDDTTGRQRASGRVALVDCDDDQRAIALTMTTDDPQTWAKIKEGVYTGLTVHTKPGQRGAQIPHRAVLTDRASTNPKHHHMKLAKRGGPSVTVALKARYDAAVSPLNKRDGSLDPFRAIFSKAPKVGRF